MPVSVNSIAVGNCYKTSNEQHRRVVAINGSQTTYEYWGGNVGYQGGSLARQKVDINKFADDVDAPITCPAGLPGMPTI
jgi:hypothetical protein